MYPLTTRRSEKRVEENATVSFFRHRKPRIHLCITF